MAVKSDYKGFVDPNLGAAFDCKLTLPHILLNTYALGFRHAIIDLAPENVLSEVFSKQDILAYRTHSYSIYTYLRCRNLMLTVPASRLRVKQQAVFVKLYKLAQAMRCKALILNTAPNLQSTTGCTWAATTTFLENMFDICGSDIPVYLETTPPVMSHIGHIQGLKTIIDSVGPDRTGVAFDPAHVQYWKLDMWGLPLDRLGFTLIEYHDIIRLVLLNPTRPHDTLQDENAPEKIRNLVSRFPCVIKNVRMSDVFEEKNFILDALAGQ